MNNKILFGLVLLLSLATVSAQDTGEQEKDRLYVTDQLRLSLYQQATDRSQAIKLLQSGDLLEVDEISGAYALVTTREGTKGWVKRGFLVSSPTGRILLEQEIKKTKDLEAEIEKLSNSKVVIDQYEKDMNTLMEKMGEMEAQNQQAAEAITGLNQEIENKQAEIDRKDSDTAPAMLVLLDTFKSYWQIIVPIVLVIILISFLVSKVVVEARIKSKFHGIKIW